MADVSKIKLLDNSEYNIKDAFKSGIYVVKGTQTASTGTWTGALHGVSALYDGLTIMYYLPWAGSGNATLNLTLDDGTTTGAINCYYGNTTRLTTHYGKGNNIVMTYWSAGSISIDGTATTDNRWIAEACYDVNDTAYYVRRSQTDILAGPNKILPYTIVMENADSRWESIVTSSTTASTKVKNSHGFRLGNILFMYANATYNENVRVANNNLWEMHTGTPDARYTFNVENNATKGLLANKPIYLVGTLSDDGLFYLDTTWWTQTLPSTEDGKLYIHIGDAYDYYRFSFLLHRPIYHYSNGAIREFIQDANTVNGHTVNSDVPANAVFTDNNDAVAQTPTNSTNADYRVLMSSTADDNQHTEGARKDSAFKYNPYYNKLYAGCIEAKESYSTLHSNSVFDAPDNTKIVANASALIQSPIPKYLWHDVFAFCRVNTPTYYVSADNTIWTEATLDKRHFAGLDRFKVTVIAATGQTGARWVWHHSGFQYCSAAWLVLGVAYTATSANVTILFESSADGETWTTRHISTHQASSNPIWCKVKSNSADAYLRLTLTKDVSDTTGAMNIGAIKLLTARWGDQGQGAEYEYPYNWDADGVITPMNTGSAPALGTSSTPWRNGYFTNINGVAVGSSPKFTDTTYSMTRDAEKVKLTPSSGTAQTVSLNDLINGLTEGTSTPNDNDYYISQYVNGGTTTTTYHRRPMSALWTWIKGKIDTIFGCKNGQSGGTDVTMVTTGDKYDWTNTKASTIKVGTTPYTTTNGVVELPAYPTVPTVNNATLTIKQNNTSKGTFTANQATDQTIDLTDTTYESKQEAQGGTALSLVTTGEKYTWNHNAGGTDEKVKQSPTTDNANYRVILSDSANDTEETSGVKKNSSLKYNPSTGNLQTTQLNGVDVGSSPKFSDENVKQTKTTSGTEYELLLSGTASDSTATEQARKCPHFQVDASNGVLTVSKVHTSTSKADSRIDIGNDTATGTAGCTRGYLRMYAADGKYTNLVPSEGQTTDRSLYLPVTNGNKTLAIEDDIKNGTLTIKQNSSSKGTFTANQSSNTTIDLTDEKVGHQVWSSSPDAFYDVLLSGQDTTNSTYTSKVYHDGCIAFNPHSDVLFLSDGGSTASFRVGTNYGSAHGTDPEFADLRKDSLYFRTGGHINVSSSGIQVMVFAASTENDYRVKLGVWDGSWMFAPTKSGKLTLGGANYKWGQIYSTNGSINTSDRNEKKDIKSLDESAKDFVMALNPVSYKFKDGKSGRTHYGMIAQDVENEMSELGMSPKDFAGFCKDQKTVPFINGDDDTASMPVEGKYVYGLRYDEFIAPMIKTIQMQQQEIDELKQQLAEIKAMLNGGN